MDIVLVQKDIIKIKGKHSSLVIGTPEAGAIRTKTQADAVLLLERDGSFDFSKVENSRLFIKGQGEYEIAGIKISAFLTNDDLIYDMRVDNLDILLGATGAVKKVKDKLKEEKIAIFYTNSSIDESVITAIEPNVAVFYGEKAEDAVKILGKSAKHLQKYSTTLEKLPAEMEVVLLGESSYSSA